MAEPITQWTGNSQRTETTTTRRKPGRKKARKKERKKRNPPSLRRCGPGWTLRERAPALSPCLPPRLTCHTHTLCVCGCVSLFVVVCCSGKKKKPERKLNADHQASAVRQCVSVRPSRPTNATSLHLSSLPALPLSFVPSLCLSVCLSSCHTHTHTPCPSKSSVKSE